MASGLRSFVSTSYAAIMSVPRLRDVTNVVRPPGTAGDPGDPGITHEYAALTVYVAAAPETVGPDVNLP